MPGPRPKPEIVRHQEGRRDKRPARVEPQPSVGTPPAPDWFDAAARRVWNLWIPELEKTGKLARIDGPALEAACAAYALAVQCRRRIKKKGLTMNVGNGYQQVRPEVSIEAKAWATFRSFCVEFGLTPAARVRLAIEQPGDEDNDIERLLA